MLSRARSHTDPSRASSALAESEDPAPKAQAQASRPTHLRSQSYLAPSSAEVKPEAKPRNAHALPAPPSALERTASRLHLPGSSHRHHKEKEHGASNHRHTQSHNLSQHNNDSTHSLSFRRHRPTQSEAHGLARHPPKEPLSHLVAGLNAERGRRNQQGDKHNPINPTNRHGAANAYAQAQHHTQFGPAVAQPNDFEAGGRYDPNNPPPRRRANSDPSNHDGLAPLRPKTSVEEALSRGDATRIARRIHVRKSDLLRRDADLATGQDELRAKVSEITATGVEITRRLDYGYYNLLEQVGSLVGMIGSFQQLARQSGALIGNLEKEGGRIEGDTGRRIGTFREGFDARQGKAQRLMERGERAGKKATEFSTRLEAARVRVAEWETKEDKVRRTWDRVWGMCWWTSISVIILVVAVVVGKEWYFQGDPVKAGLRQHGEGSWNGSLRLGGGGDAERVVLGSPQEVQTANGLERKPHVPEEVQQILAGIAERNKVRKKAFPEVPVEMFESYHELTGEANEGHEKDDPRLRRLDEL